ncbi:MAG: tetratricopeptide repeat protein [Myxococcota bacterium]|nr:tetratricopeptide repeat protein [Myxococcota bacterium]
MTRRSPLSAWLLAAGLLLPGTAAGQGPWQPPPEGQEPYVPFRGRPTAVPLAPAAPTAGPGLLPPPPGQPRALGPVAPGAGLGLPGSPGVPLSPAEQEVLAKLPQVEWLPGLPPPPGLLESGLSVPPPALRLHDLAGCTEALADAVAYQITGSFRAGITTARSVVQACPELAEAPVILGMLELLGQQSRQASVTLLAAYDRKQRVGEVLTLMGIWCLFLGDLHGGIENLHEALLVDPEQWRARLALASLRLAEGKRDAALRTIAPLARRPGQLRSTLDLDLLDLNPLAQQLLEAATRRDHPRCAPCQRTLADIDAAEAQRRRGLASYTHWQRLIDRLSAMLEAQPEDAETRVALGRALGMVASHEAAVRLYEEGRARGDARFTELLGAALLDTGKPDRALPHLREATRRTPDKAETWILLGTAQRILGLDEAAASLRRAAQLAPERATIFNDLGQIYLSRGQPAEALDAYRQALARQPNLRQARYGLAQALLGLGRQAEAERELAVYQELLVALQQSLTLQERQANRDSAVYEGLNHLQARRTQRAREAFAPVLREVPEHAVASFGMAALLWEEGRGPEAEPYLERLLRVSLRGNSFIQSAARGGKPAGEVGRPTAQEQAR